MKKTIFIFLFFVSLISFSQEENVPKEVVLTTNDSLKGKELDNVPFAIIEEIPVFPGCEDVEKKERMNCFNAKMSEHIKANFKYPSKAQKRNIQGRVSVQFVIDKEGNVVDVQTRGADPILQTEARRIFSLLPKMKPGFQKGKPVKVRYGMPLNFKLQR
ncbi:energy transducer TonB [Flavobacterium sp.]|jgi:protein TonB|uniref:energy transducer TonB n=1 Tax=Flavobacterium sp. TaxID=239 RepID=UPI002A81FACF|nr:energy transducer TonB [Flavobacterium sp.]